MKTNNRAKDHTRNQPAERNRQSVTVILDTGKQAWVRSFSAKAGLETGVVFSHAGTTWEVIAYREHARAYVAVPLRERLNAKATSDADTAPHLQLTECCATQPA
ncbi:MAG: hypothetical protein GY906_08530 [bacterium]|nr:hypothetical protein [bacterium]